MSVNRISLEITDAQKAAVSAATTELATAIKEFNVVISRDELKSFQTIGDTRLPFVEKVAQYAASNPEFLQPNADVPEFRKDLKTFKDAREMVRPVRQIVDNLEATMRVGGGEALKFSRDFYASLQLHAKMGVPGAQTILDDLRPLFEARASGSESKE